MAGVKPNYVLTQANAPELEKLFEHRSQVSYWRGKMTVAQYLERTRRIFRHSFARDRIQILILSDER